MGLPAFAWNSLTGDGLRFFEGNPADTKRTRTLPKLTPAPTVPNCELYTGEREIILPQGRDWSGCDLAGADLSWRDLSGYDLSGANLTSARLIGTTLLGTKFNHATLVNAYIRPRNNQAQGATFHAADLTGANMSHSDMSGTDLSGATLTRIIARRTRFIGSSIYDTEVSGAQFHDARFIQADLSMLRTEHPEGRAVDFSDCIFAFSTLAHAAVRQGIFHGSRFEHTDLTEMDGRGGEFVSTEFLLCTLTNTDFREKATLEAASILDTSVNSAKFDDTTIMPSGRPYGELTQRTRPPALALPCIPSVTLREPLSNKSANVAPAGATPQQIVNRMLYLASR